MTTLLVFATHEEAKATKAACLSCFDILITGMGPHTAYAALQKTIERYDLIINAGIVGTLRNDLPLGYCTPIKSVTSSYDTDTIYLSSEGYSLITMEQPLYEKGLPFDLVDMEGYAIAALCKTAGKEVRFIKVISDHVGPDSMQQIRKHLPQLSQSLCDELVKISLSEK